MSPHLGTEYSPRGTRLVHANRRTRFNEPIFSKLLMCHNVSGSQILGTLRRGLIVVDS